MVEKQCHLGLKRSDKQPWGGNGGEERIAESVETEGDVSMCLDSPHLFMCSSLFGIHSRVAVTSALACGECKPY